MFWDTDGASRGATPGSTAPGVWGANTYWSTASGGGTATTAWVPGRQAIFSTGSDASGTFTVTVSGNQIASGITFQDGTVTLSGGKITLTNGPGNATIKVASDHSATIAAQIAGANGLFKTGEGTLTLSGANTYSGTTDLRNGTLLIGNNAALGSSTLSFDGGTIGASGFSRILNNAVSVVKDSIIGGSQNITFTGDFLQSGGSRTITVNNTALTALAGSSLTLAGNNQTRTLTLDVAGGDLSIANIIRDGTGSGADGLTKNGVGTLILTGNNTFTGNLLHNAGTLILGNDSAAGRGTLALGNGVTIAATGGSRTIANNVTLGGNITFDGVDPLAFTHVISLNGNRTFTVKNTTTFNGVISGNGNTLTKNGTGTLILTAANTYTGGTIINAGTLLVRNTTGSGTGTGTVTVNTTGVFGGTGTVSGRITLNSGSAISPGGNPGRLNTAGETWNGGAKYILEMNDVNSGEGTGWDSLNINGSLTLGASSGNPIILELHSLTLANSAGAVHDFNSASSYSWRIITTTGGLLFNPGENEDTLFRVSTNSFLNNLDGGRLTLDLANGNRDLILNFTPRAVPEPDTRCMIGAGFILLLARRRIFRML